MTADQKQQFVFLVTEHQNIIHKVCNVYCYTDEDKRDLYQEITLQLWKSFAGFKGNSSFSTWMYRVALNTAITQTKKRNPFVEIKEPELLLLNKENDNMDLDEDIRILYKAIGKLKKVEKAVVLLWLEEKSYEEIAETTGISVKNVSVKLVRVKAKLADLIQKLQ